MSTPSEAPAIGPTLPVTARGQRTRSKLVKAARSEFERNGYLDTNIQDIARRAKVAYGTFYTYFTSKEEVFGEVVAEVRDQQRTISAAEPWRGDDPASRIARANAGYLRAYRECATIMAVIEQVATFSPRLAETRRDARRYWVSRSEAAIARWKADGIVRADVDPYYAASALGSMVDRSAYVWFVLGEPFEERAAVEQLTLLYCGALGITPVLAAPPRAQTPRSRR